MMMPDYIPHREDRARFEEDAPRSLNSRAYAALPAGQRGKCSECGWRGDIDDLTFPNYLHERINEGEPMWAGDCPRCRCLVNSDSQLAIWKQERAEEAAGLKARDRLTSIIEWTGDDHDMPAEPAARLEWYARRLLMIRNAARAGLEPCSETEEIRLRRFNAGLPQIEEVAS